MAADLQLQQSKLKVFWNDASVFYPSGTTGKAPSINPVLELNEQA